MKKNNKYHSDTFRQHLIEYIHTCSMHIHINLPHRWQCVLTVCLCTYGIHPYSQYWYTEANSFHHNQI